MVSACLFSVAMTACYHDGMTTATALGNLRDAIRAEIIAEFVAKLEELRDGGEVDHYRDGVDDAIAVLKGE
jgi:hypothetical protein